MLFRISSSESYLLCGNVLYFLTLGDLVVLNYHSSSIDLNVKVGIVIYFGIIIQIEKRASAWHVILNCEFIDV